MSNLTVSAPEGSKIPVIEPGTYPAVCIGIYDIGEQYNERYQKFTRKCIFQFEIPGETILVEDEEKPRVISETYTASLAEKSNLRNVLEGWRGRQFTQDELRGFDLENVLGVPCMLSIIHAESSKGNTFAKINGISKLPKGFVVETETPCIIFSLADSDALSRIESFPEWIQKRIKESSTYNGLASIPSGFVDVNDEDLPF